MVIDLICSQRPEKAPKGDLPMTISLVYFHRPVVSKVCDYVPWIIFLIPLLVISQPSVSCWYRSRRVCSKLVRTLKRDLLVVLHTVSNAISETPEFLFNNSQLILWFRLSCHEILPLQCLETFPQEQDNPETPEKHKELSHRKATKNTLLESEAHKLRVAREGWERIDLPGLLLPSPSRWSCDPWVPVLQARFLKCHIPLWWGNKE